ncbi:hypothetical protein X798_05345 [Onchocerca flexuosa]|uniref:Uncharacterized protein n=1 Tax=Onchocerca flexuosa TaxID=387005 RepID=A0A238BQH1_9BILA|nr:hypothetical protein X798_05345 [Onchocerca flexuosa]
MVGSSRRVRIDNGLKIQEIHNMAVKYSILSVSLVQHDTYQDINKKIKAKDRNDNDDDTVSLYHIGEYSA